MVAFGEQLRGYLPPRARGGPPRRSADRARRRAAPSGRTDLPRALAYLSEVAQRRSLIVLFSDLLGSAGDAGAPPVARAARAQARRGGLPPARPRRADAAVRGHHRLRVDGGRAEAARRSGRRAQGLPGASSSASSTAIARGAAPRATSSTTWSTPRSRRPRCWCASSPARIRTRRRAGAAAVHELPRARLRRLRRCCSRVPIAIHLIGRSRAKVRRFAALELLLRSEQAGRAPHQDPPVAAAAAARAGHRRGAAHPGQAVRRGGQRSAGAAVGGAQTRGDRARRLDVDVGRAATASRCSKRRGRARAASSTRSAATPRRRCVLASRGGGAPVPS